MVHDYIDQIRMLLPSVDSSSYGSASRLDDVYEGYVFSLIVATAVARGASVHFADVQSRRTADLLFRSSPGQIYSRDRPYTHAVIEFKGAPPLEAHIGVRVQGGSGVLHECDVLVLSTDEARSSRLNEVAPRGNRCLLAIECKHYVATSLSLGLARNFEGLHADIRTKSAIFVANLDSQSVRKYLVARKREFEHNVSPGSYETDALCKTIRKLFRNYVSEFAPSVRV